MFPMQRELAACQASCAGQEASASTDTDYGLADKPTQVVGQAVVDANFGPPQTMVWSAALSLQMQASTANGVPAADGTGWPSTERRRSLNWGRTWFARRSGSDVDRSLDSCATGNA